ncbi:MAG TPA: HEPN domain-containing protein [Rhodocyclaceae bacterium]|nr:HEPN domain-containing protein [Rhodocyclaceae bacterium]
MSAELEEALRLLRMAERDQRAYLALIDAISPEDFPSAAFHAQQAIEKSLKAVLCLHQIPFRRTHDLLELAGRVAEADIALPIDDNALLRITPYAVEFRYDDQALPLITVEAAAEATALCVDWCRQHLAGASE